MKPFDITLVISGAFSLLAALISIINAITSDKSKENKIKNVLLTFLAIFMVWGLIFLFAHAFKAESDILGLHPITVSPSPDVSPEAYSTSSNIEPAITTNSTESTIPSEYIDPQPPQNTEDHSSYLDLYGIPHTWFEESEYWGLQWLQEDYDFNSEPTTFNDNVVFLASGCHFAPTNGYTPNYRDNGFIIDKVECYDSDDPNNPEIVSMYSWANNGQEFESYKAVYCEFHLKHEIEKQGWGFGGFIYDSSGEESNIQRNFTHHFDSRSGYFIFYIYSPNNIFEDTYLLQCFLDKDLDEFINAYFLLDFS